MAKFFGWKNHKDANFRKVYVNKKIFTGMFWISQKNGLLASPNLTSTQPKSNLAEDGFAIKMTLCNQCGVIIGPNEQT